MKQSPVLSTGIDTASHDRPTVARRHELRPAQEMLAFPATPAEFVFRHHRVRADAEARIAAAAEQAGLTSADGGETGRWCAPKGRQAFLPPDAEQ